LISGFLPAGISALLAPRLIFLGVVAARSFKYRGDFSVWFAVGLPQTPALSF
jgi:hypothetical protein